MLDATTYERVPFFVFLPAIALNDLICCYTSRFVVLGLGTRRKEKALLSLQTTVRYDETRFLSEVTIASHSPLLEDRVAGARTADMCCAQHLRADKEC